MKKLYYFLFTAFSLFTCTHGFSQTVHTVVASNTATVFSFTPNNFTAAVGDSILFTFGNPGAGIPGGFAHTTTSVTIPAGASAWDSPLNGTTNQSFKYVVKVPGDYNYKCTPHAASPRFMVAQFSVSSVAPVKLVNFSVAELNGKAQLNWQTSSEENSDHFSIQQSYNGLDFAEVGVTNAAGNSNANIKYSYTVSNIKANTPYVYFRLLTIDRDLKQQYSDIILLHFGKVVDQSLIKSFYPNPAANGDHLLFSFDANNDSKIQVTIYETSGRQLYTTQGAAITGVNLLHFPLPRLRKGAYFVQFVLGDKKQTMPLFIK